MPKQQTKKPRGKNGGAKPKYANGTIKKLISIPKDGWSEINEFIKQTRLKYKL
jgi:hypothetical protein